MNRDRATPQRRDFAGRIGANSGIVDALPNPLMKLLTLTSLFMVVAACSVDPLMPEGKGGSGGAAGRGGEGGTSAAGGTLGSPTCGDGIPAIACAVGRTVFVCEPDASGRPVWMIRCPDDPSGGGGSSGASGSGAGGAAGGSSGAGGAPCASTSSCAADEVCTTADGACNAPPGCSTGSACPAVCYGNCRPANEGGACSRDTDCRVEADYCTGCDCRALATGQSLPRCPGPGVRCLVDPCGGKMAACVNGRCAVR